MLFEKAGKHNTEQTLTLAKNEALQKSIKQVLVASTFGDTGVSAARMFSATGIQLIVITHNTGFKELGVQELAQEAKDEIMHLGGIVYTGTLVLRGLGASIRERMHYSYEQLVADTLRMFGQGIKVCVEMAAMACDAGLIPPVDIIAVAGSQRGADTAAIIKAEASNRFFNIKVREILVKPCDF